MGESENEDNFGLTRVDFSALDFSAFDTITKSEIESGKPRKSPEKKSKKRKAHLQEMEASTFQSSTSVVVQPKESIRIPRTKVTSYKEPSLKAKMRRQSTENPP
jgi:hypothetical protein